MQCCHSNNDAIVFLWHHVAAAELSEWIAQYHAATEYSTVAVPLQRSHRFVAWLLQRAARKQIGNALSQSQLPKGEFARNCTEQGSCMLKHHSISEMTKLATKETATSTSSCLNDSGPALSRFCASYGRFSNKTNPSEQVIYTNLHTGKSGMTDDLQLLTKNCLWISNYSNRKHQRATKQCGKNI